MGVSTGGFDFGAEALGFDGASDAGSRFGADITRGAADAAGFAARSAGAGLEATDVAASGGDFAAVGANAAGGACAALVGAVPDLEAVGRALGVE
jgi:hypothetical protein